MSKKQRVSRRDRNVFLHYGKGFESHSHDEFHRLYQTLDVDDLREAQTEHLVEIPESILLLQRTRGKPTLEQWSAVTGYVPVTEDERMAYASQAADQITVDNDALPAAELDALLGKNHMGASIGDEKPTKVVSALSPTPVDWTKFTPAPAQSCYNLAPELDRGGGTNSLAELELALARLLQKRKPLDKWSNLMKRCGLINFRFTQLSVGGNRRVQYYVSSPYQVFVLLLLRPVANTSAEKEDEEVELENYFFLSPLPQE